MKFYEFIRQKRRKFEFTQEKIANCLDISRATYNQFEKGKVGLDYKEFVKLLNKLAIHFKDAAEIITEEEELNAMQNTSAIDTLKYID
jgi:DNA-binding XRE family transcriptional regulator